MSALVVGDTHSKHMHILDNIESVARREGCDTIIFLGDYCDEFSVSDDYVIKNLRYLADFKESISDINLVFLYGNHDFSYMYDGYRCSGHRSFISRYVKDILLNLDMKIAYEYLGYTLSHAGFTGWWVWSASAFVEDSLKYDTSDMSAIDIVDILLDNIDIKESKDLLFSVGLYRGGYGQPGPLWSDKKELLSDSLIEIDQVVGHTPVPYIMELMSNGGDDIVFCDTLSMDRNGNPIGNGDLLILEDDGSKRIVNISDEGSYRDLINGHKNTIRMELYRDIFNM